MKLLGLTEGGAVDPCREDVNSCREEVDPGTVMGGIGQDAGSNIIQFVFNDIYRIN